VDDEVYLYTQFESADARRMYACFEQPDLKAPFTLHVTAPDHWQVVSNAPTPEPVNLGQGAARWDFAATPRIPTYITALVAGPYYAVRDSYTGEFGTYPLGISRRPASPSSRTSSASATRSGSTTSSSFPSSMQAPWRTQDA
jgi:aminopeptidase N